MMRAAAADARRGGELLREMRRVLDEGMGVRRQWGPGIFGLGPAGSAAAWLLFYAFVWTLAEVAAVALHVPSAPRLVSLLAWGGCYAGAVIVFAQTATRLVFETVEREILPHASEAYCAAVAEDLAKRYPPALFTGAPVLLGVASLAAGLWAIDRDVGLHGPTALYAPELLLWAVSYFYYFVAAVRAVMAGRFYLSFARHLEQERGSFYVLGAAESPMIRGLSRLGGVMLGFWAMVFLTVLSIMLLAALPLGAHGFEGQSKFLFTLVPIAGFFSLGFGSLVYLNSEGRIRAVLRRFTCDQAAVLQGEANALFDPASGRTEADPDALQRLADLHDRILAGGRYGSRLRAVLSIALPLLLPIVSLIQTAYSWLQR